jgi:hypothetical protein
MQTLPTEPKPSLGDKEARTKKSYPGHLKIMQDLKCIRVKMEVASIHAERQKKVPFGP